MLYNRREFLTQIGMSTAGLGLLTSLPAAGYIKPVSKITLPRSAPELQGVSADGLSTFLDEVKKSKIEFHSIMVLRHGNVVAEGWWAPYAAPLKHTLYSLSKSFTSTAVGLAVGEERLSVEDLVASFFPSDLPEVVNKNITSMRVKHLLTMSTGHVKDTIQPMRSSTDNWAKTFFSLPVEREPGTFFLYNTGATYILSAIVQKLTGQTLLEYLRPRIFEPLGIEGEDWETDPQGVNTGGYGLRVKTEDLAKFGQLYLQKGKWQGKQILSETWIEDATRTQIASNSSNPTRPKEEDDWAQGYGYQFWCCRPGGYRADGAFGQFSIVMPEYDAVVAVTSESFSMQKSMDLIWSYLLPAIDKNKMKLPAADKAEKQLRLNLKELQLPTPQQNVSSPVAMHISGKLFTLEANNFKTQNIRLDFSASACVLTLNSEKGKHQITCCINKWHTQKNEKKGPPFPSSERMEVPTAIAASATWKDDQTLVITLRLIESAHTDMLTFAFEGNSMTLKFMNSISIGNPHTLEKRSDIKGTIIA